MISPRSGERTAALILTVLGDSAAGLAALLLVVFLRRNIDLPFTRALMAPQKYPLVPSTFAVVIGSLVLGLAMAGFYDQRMSRRGRPRLAIALLLQASQLALVATLVERLIPRTVLVGVPLIEAVLLPLWHRLARFALRRESSATVLVGESGGVQQFLSDMRAHGTAMKVAGVVGPEAVHIEGAPYYGTLESEEGSERLKAAEEVIFISSPALAPFRLPLLAARGPEGYLLLPSTADAVVTSAVSGWVGDQPLVEIAVRCGFGPGAVVKRLFDLLAAIVIGVLSLPLWVGAAIAILLEDGSPVLLRQPRLGRAAIPFSMLKFRTMKADQVSPADQLATDDDERFTRVGRILRRYRVDELPQLLNILRGEMSMVGPRPEQPSIHARIAEEMPEFALRCMIRPGLAGLAQVSSEYDTPPAVKLRYDLTYLRNWSLWLDVRILFRALSTVLTGRGV